MVTCPRTRDVFFTEQEDAAFFGAFAILDAVELHRDVQLVLVPRLELDKVHTEYMATSPRVHEYLEIYPMYYYGYQVYQRYRENGGLFYDFKPV